jgi:hypothetical protein
VNTDDEFRDLAPLSLKLDPDRWARMTLAIEAAVAPELDRRAAAADPGLLLMLSAWTRPAFSGALALASSAALYLTLGGVGSTATIPTGVSDELGYPVSVGAWVETGRTPSVEELVFTMSGVTP